MAGYKSERVLRLGHGRMLCVGDYVCADVREYEGSIVKSREAYCGRIVKIGKHSVWVKAADGETRGKSGKFQIGEATHIAEVCPPGEHAIGAPEGIWDGTAQVNCRDDMEMSIF